MIDADIAMSENLAPIVAQGRENAPQGIDTPLPGVAWLLFRRDVIKGAFSGKPLGTGCSQQCGVATDEGDGCSAKTRP
jgi:hypothetical protein